MKILAIRIHNLASLGGKTVIDFTNEPLSSAGIFAITGPTGSGKSTILDALCLSLYARTPRYRHAENSIDVADVKGSTIKQGDVRGILRDGSSSGYAEVDFVGVDGHHYSSTWSVRRARNKAEGNLQPYEMSLKNISTDQDIPGKKTELLPEIERLVGLNFEQFTRSVLLAQGDFTAFLKAAKDEKSSLLEKLTGTHIYSEISKKVYEHHKEESQNLKVLDVQREGIATLTTEELKDYKIQKEKLGTLVKADEKRFEELNKQVSWHERWIELQGSVQSAKQKYDSAFKAKEEAKPREVKFQQIVGVQSARPIFTERNGVKQQHSLKADNASKLSTKIDFLKKDKKEADESFKKANAAFDIKQKQEQEAQPLLNAAKALDVKLLEKSEQVEHASEELIRVNRKLTLQTKESAEVLIELGSVKEEILELQQWKADNESRGPIAEQENLILSKLQDAGGILQNLKYYNARIKKAEEDILINRKEQEDFLNKGDAIEGDLKQKKSDFESLTAALSKVSFEKNEKEKAALDTSIEDLIGATAHWKLLFSAVSEKDKLQQTLKSNKEELEHTTVKLTQAKKLLVTKTLEKDASLKMLEKAKLAAAESVEELRSHLVPEEPCPVCGSSHHPYATHHPGLDHVLDKLEAEHKKIDSEYINQLTLHNTLGQNATQLEKLIKEQEKKLLEKETDLAELKRIWSSFQVSTQCNTFPQEERSSWLQQQLKKQKERQQKLQEALQSYNKQKLELENHRSQLDKLQIEYDQILNSIKDAERNLKTLEEQKQNDTNERDKINKNLEELKEALSGYFSSKEWFENWQSNPDSFVSQIKDFSSNWKSNISKLDSLVRKQELLSEKSKALETPLNVTREEVTSLHKKYADLQNQNKKLLEQRTVLFKGSPVTEVEAKLKAAVESAKKTLEDQRKVLDKINEDITRNSAQYEQLLKDVNSLSKKVAELKGQLENWISDYNAQNETILSQEGLLSLLEYSQDWIETERNSLRGIDEGVMQANSVLKERTKTLDTHTKQRTSEMSLEELTAIRVEVEESLKKNRQASNEIDFKINQDTQNKKLIGTLLERINKQADVVENWAKLNEIIGSADGKKFRQIAQEYTLDVLLSYANVHLEVLSKRYILQRIPNSLGLQVLDQDMGDEVRTVYSLSGGESFLVSLALALGLASLSSARMKVESLFIDEGFGSLDPATLNIAMDALERLHNQGRKVGVISHVQEMTERIPVQIKVSKQQSGKSKVEVVGC
ncbi:SMC domain-containing protein [Galbibacter marinus]|uniref:SMC domain-containing protein n=1 Tax=Galbibacter marinus TaxID=555500 RepID=K2PPG5_9FLAO|nr:AAA family ATPase [Galbibacter marinus]EKF54420.1 SMC domain-containing protein [Galbibacter marinus]